jgi:hypothetical protein
VNAYAVSSWPVTPIPRSKSCAICGNMPATTPASVPVAKIANASR